MKAQTKKRNASPTPSTPKPSTGLTEKHQITIWMTIQKRPLESLPPLWPELSPPPEEYDPLLEEELPLDEDEPLPQRDPPKLPPVCWAIDSTTMLARGDAIAAGSASTSARSARIHNAKSEGRWRTKDDIMARIGEPSQGRASGADRSRLRGHGAVALGADRMIEGAEGEPHHAASAVPHGAPRIGCDDAMLKYVGVRSGIFIVRILRANGARSTTGQGSLFTGGVFVRSRHGGNEGAVKVLLVGGGGREHALAWALAKAGSVDELVVAPGNPGIAEIARCVAVGLGDIDGLVGTAVAMAADLVVIGPEGPLVAGLADRLRALRIPVFGPSAAAARLEGSKGFLKDLCARHGIPTAAYRRFTDADEATAYVREHGAPVVVKVDGLAAGKGVVVAASVDEAIAAIDEALRRGRFGDAGRSVVVEDFLVGPEMSFFALSDGSAATFFATAMDYKRLGDGSVGPNTGGMGAITPHPQQSPALIEEVMATIIRPTVDAMREEGTPFRGVLYAGLMLTARGPMLLEYNVRFGDPECQALMVMLDDDLGEILREAAREEERPMVRLPRWQPGAVVCVVLATPGYPDNPATGGVINGLGGSLKEGTWIFHAGTRRDADGVLRTAGGRVLNVVAQGASLAAAAERAYAVADTIDWPGAQYRSDVGTVVLP